MGIREGKVAIESPPLFKMHTATAGQTPPEARLDIKMRPELWHASINPG